MKLYYDLVHTDIEQIDVSRDVVLWNFLDFDHVNHFHTRSYHHCKVLGAAGNARFLEYGVKQFMGLPLVKKYVMWHNYIPPDTIQHISPGPFGGYNRVHIKFIETKDAQGRPHTRIEHSYRLPLPIFMKPFEWFFRWYMKKWNQILWEEDGSMLRRRQKVVDLGFKDYGADQPAPGA